MLCLWHVGKTYDIIDIKLPRYLLSVRWETESGVHFPRNTTDSQTASLI